MGQALAKAVGRISCKSSCSLSQDEKELISFKKTLRLDEISFIKDLIEDWRSQPPIEVLEKKLQSHKISTI
jgi:hypothetical protein